MRTPRERVATPRSRAGSARWRSRCPFWSRRSIHQLAAQYRSTGRRGRGGTVLDGHFAYECHAGATFLVSPQLNPRDDPRREPLSSPHDQGAFTSTEILESVEAGADIVKLFPTENAGIPYAKAVLAAGARADHARRRGNTRNVKEWFAAVWPVSEWAAPSPKAWQPDGDFTRVTAAAHDFRAAVQDARR